MRFQSDKTNIAVLVAIALVLFGIVSSLLQLPANALLPSFIFPDSYTYLRAAGYLFHDGFAADPTRPFGYPILIGIPYLLGFTGQSSVITFSIFLNFIFWISSVLLVYDIVKQLLGSRLAFFAALIFVFCISNMLMIYQVMSETFFVLVILLFARFLLRYINTKSVGSLLGALFFLCYSVVVRPISLYFAILFLLFCVVLFLKRKQFKPLAISLLIFMCTIGLQVGMMHQRFGRNSISFIQNYTVNTYLVTKARYLEQGKKGSFGEFNQREQNTADSTIATLVDPNNTAPYFLAADKVYKSNISSTLAGDKKYLLYAYLYNVYENAYAGSIVLAYTKDVAGKGSFNPTLKVIDRLTSYQNKAYSVLMLLCFCLIMVTVLVKRSKLPTQYSFIVVLNLITSYFFLTSGISFWQGDRFSIAWYPLFIISAFYFVSRVSAAGAKQPYTE